MEATRISLPQLREQRLEKIQKLNALGINAYPAKSNKTNILSDIINKFEEFENKEVILAGRLLSIREHGKLVFGNIEDQDGNIQLYIKSDEIASHDAEKHNLGFDELNLLDIGDFVEVSGTVTKTQRGEISILVKSLWILSKSLRPLPDKWNGIVDKEQRYRRRYLDLAVSKDIRNQFIRKSKFWAACRKFMEENGYLEVETPVMELKTGGADAKPFITHHNDLDLDLYLRISTELYQKRLIGGGFEKIFTLGPNFRNEGVDDEHLQEYSALEWYWAYANYEDNMNLVKELFRYVAKSVYGKTEFTSRGHIYDLANDWTVIDYIGVIKEKLGIDIFTATDEEMLKVIKEKKVNLTGAINRNRLIDNLWKIIRKEISGPAFLVNEPKFMSPLAKSKPENNELTERFHIIIAGSELGNGYSEINDPVDQLDRFMDQEKSRLEGDAESQMLDIDFVEMLEYGMPPTSGFGVSERLFWFLEDCSAREGTFFPLMRPEVENTTKEIYPELFKATNTLPKQVKQPESVSVESKSADYKLPTREEAEELLKKYIQDDYLILHSHMVAKGVEAYAEKFNGNKELWYITGLLHDLDYYQFPSEHPLKSLEWFKEWGYPEELIHAIAAHGTREPRVEPQTDLAKVLIAVDEMMGILYAYSLMRPSGFDGMEAKSAIKKFKDKAFAAKIDRSEIMYGVDILGVDLKEHIELLINTCR